MTLFADIDAQGWALITAAAIAALGAAGVSIVAGVGTIITAVVTLVLNARRENAKIKREEEAAAALKKEQDEKRSRDEAAVKALEEVKTTLRVNTARTDTKLNEIHGYVNSALQEAQRLYAVKCRDAANESPTPLNLAEAARAEAVYEAHHAQTEKMDQDKRNTPTILVMPSTSNAGPITSAELKQDILENPKRTVDEMEKRGQSPPEKAP